MRKLALEPGEALLALNLESGDRIVRAGGLQLAYVYVEVVGLGWMT